MTKKNTYSPQRPHTKHTNHRLSMRKMHALEGDERNNNNVDGKFVIKKNIMLRKIKTLLNDAKAQQNIGTKRIKLN